MNKEEYVNKMKMLKRAKKFRTRTGKSKEYLNKLHSQIKRHNNKMNRQEKKRNLVAMYWDKESKVSGQSKDVDEIIVVTRIGYKE